MAEEVASEMIQRALGLRAIAAARGVDLPYVKVITPYDRFKRTYRNDPLAFVHDCVSFPRGGSLAVYQEEILGEVPASNRQAVRSPHGAGKTCVASMFTLWGVLTADDVKAITTAGAWRQLTKFLWPEIHKWQARVDWKKVGRGPLVDGRELGKNSIDVGSTQLAFAVASNQAGLIEGAHAPRVCYVYDEAKSIPAKTFDATEGAFSTAGVETGDEAFALAISTPGEPSGRFHAIFTQRASYQDWRVRHITLEEAMAAKRVTQAWVDDRARQWGRESPIFKQRVLGEFASSMTDTVIPLEWVELANRRWHDWEDAGKPLEPPMTAVGVDVGRGGDISVLAPRYGWVVTTLDQLNIADVMPTAGRVHRALVNYGGKAVVDVIGVGAGVVDRLREMAGEPDVPYEARDIVAFNAGAGTDWRDRSGELEFVNCRAAAWWATRELLHPELGLPVALPEHPELTQELTAPRWRETSGGRIKVESKDDIIKRLGHSTNYADAVIQALVGEEVTEEWRGVVSRAELRYYG